MLQLQQLELYFGDRPLLRDVSLMINPGERVGLTGPNGAGKSTLLRIIAGVQDADAGDVHLGGGATVGYLPQDGVDPEPGRTVFEETESAFHEIIAIRNRAEELRQILSTFEGSGEWSPKQQAILEEFGTLQTKLEHAGDYSLQSDIEKILAGLGFSAKDYTRPTTEFSGGWLMRIALGKLLLRRPTYLLLDEPTNHLDIESLQWLESFM